VSNNINVSLHDLSFTASSVEVERAGTDAMGRSVLLLHIVEPGGTTHSIQIKAPTEMSWGLLVNDNRIVHQATLTTDDASTHAH